MPHDMPMAANILRIRTARGFTQQQVADKAGLSRVAFRDIETGKTKDPRVGNLQAIAAALDVGLSDLLAKAPSLASARFRSNKLRSCKAKARRDEVVRHVARWIKDFVELEGFLNDHKPWALSEVARKATSCRSKGRPVRVAEMVREALDLAEDEPIRDICGLLESAGVKVQLLETNLEGFFGMSVAEADGGPAVVVNVTEPITVERQIFTAAHELGHLLLHPGAYDLKKVAEDDGEEDEANRFASHFLMPPNAFEKKWAETHGLGFIERVLHVKRQFRVSYQTVLHRLFQTGPAYGQAMACFNAEHKARHGVFLKRKDEPARMAPEDFLEDRLSRLVRQAVERQVISLSRAAEILGIDLHSMRDRVASWKITE